MIFKRLPQMKAIIYVILFSFLIIGCQDSATSKSDSVTSTEKVYTIESLNWKMDIPENWSNMKQDHIEQYKAQGQKDAEAKFGKEIKNTWVSLLQLERKPGFNTFGVSAKTHNERRDGDYQGGKQLRFDSMKKMQENRGGIRVESTQGKFKIGDLLFDQLSMKLYTSNNNLESFQDVFEYRFPDDDIVIMSLVTSSEVTLNEMRKALANSSFD